MIVANLATYPPRRQNLEKIVATISPQVERFNIVLNQYDEVPGELAKYPNVVAVIPEKDLKDVGKFYPDVRDAQYVLLVDDDIVYPHDYVLKTINRFEALPIQNCIGGYHGSLYLRPRLRQLIRYPSLFFTYNKRVADFRSVGFHFSEELKLATVVDQLGSGAAILRGKDMPTFEYMRTSQKFVDVRLARWCFERGVTPVCLHRTANWLEELNFDESIHSGFTTKNSSCVSAEILAYAFKVKFRGLPIGNIRN